MKKHIIFIRAVLVVFAVLILSRIPAILGGQLDAVTLVSTVVEVTFVIWGLVALRK